MAKKSVKRALAIVLSVMMIVTSLPFTAISALAADKPAEVTTVENAMTAYQNKMDGTVYSNMTAAYKAYVKCQAYIDRYEVTGKTDGMQAAASDLTSKTNAMTAWTSNVTANVLGRDEVNSENTSDSEKQQVYQNLLYSETMTSSVNAAYNYGETWYGRNWFTYGSTYAHAAIHMPTTVMLYDGVKNPSMGVAYHSWFSTTNGASDNHSDHTCYLRDDTIKAGFTLKDWWHGNDGRLNFMWIWITKGNKLRAYPLRDDGNAHYAKDNDKIDEDGDRYYANVMTYSGDFTAYTKRVDPAFQTVVSADVNEKCPTLDLITDSTPVFVVNYKKYKEDIAAQGKAKLNLKTAANKCTQGGLQATINAFDAAFAFDPNNYNYAAGPEATVNTVAADMKANIDAIKNAAIGTDSEGYKALRTAINASKPSYNDGITLDDPASAYVEGTWDTFAAAYESAIAIYDNLPNTLYENAEAGASTAVAKSAADALTDAKAALQTAGKVDVTQLTIAVENAIVAISAEPVFTADSFTASRITAVTAAAQIAVWGAVENYGIDTKLLSDTAANEAIVAEQTANVVAALKKLVVSRDAMVIATKTSLNQAIANAEPALATPDDYANIGRLSDEIDEANAWMASSESGLKGDIAGNTASVIDTYSNYVNNIVLYTETLAPSFALIKDGTVVSEGTKVRNKVNSNTRGNAFTLDFTRYNGTIIFKTKHGKTEYRLPKAEFEFFTTQDYDIVLDSININADPAIDMGELNNDNSALSEGQLNMYPGALSAYNGNITYELKEIYVTNPSNKSLIGKDINGSDIGADRLTTYDFTEALSVTQGTSPASGGIVTKKGTTYFTAQPVLTDDGTKAATLTKTTVPVLHKFNTGGDGADGYLGYVYKWTYRDFISPYRGYSFDRVQCAMQYYVVDVSYLMDLFDEVALLNKDDYSNASWKALQTALADAKADFPYNEMSAEEIRDEVVTRYNNLFTAYKALGFSNPASNTELKAILNKSKAALDNDTDKATAASLTNLNAVYREVYTEYQDKYQDTKIRDYDKDEYQDVIDALTARLQAAYDALVYFADFTKLAPAVTTLANQIASEAASLSTPIFTAEALKAVEDALADPAQFPWLNTPESEWHNYYATNDENDSQKAIDAEVERIKGLFPETATIDRSAFESAADKVYELYEDKDAWDGLDDAASTIRDAYNRIETTVDFLGKKVKAISPEFDTQAEIDAYAMTIMEQVQPMYYSVEVNGVKLNADGFKYGTYLYITSDGEYSLTEPAQSTIDGCKKTAWLYSYNSKTVESYGPKLISTDSYIGFVVKGNTSFTTQFDTEEGSDTVKITYVTNLNGKAYDVKYVAAGSTVDLSDKDYKPFAYYNFVNYTVDGEVVTSFTASANTIVVANYEYSNPVTYTVDVYGLKGALSDYNALSEVNYNDTIKFQYTDGYYARRGKGKIYVDTANTDKYAGGVYQTAAARTTAVEKWATINTSNPDVIAAWKAIFAKVTSDSKTNAASLEMYEYTAEELELLKGTISAVDYDSDYAFRVSGDMVVLALTDSQYESLIASGAVVAADKNSACVNVKEDLVIGADKFSMIGQYAIPSTATLVECGILFQSFGNATAPTLDLTIGNVGKTDPAGPNKIMRIKSSQQTVGNQFVISVKSGSLSGAVAMQYAGYVIYKTEDGSIETVYSNPVSLTQNF